MVIHAAIASVLKWENNFEQASNTWNKACWNKNKNRP